MTERRPDMLTIQGIEALIDQPAEILAKKIQHRGISMPVRDIFDLAVVMREDAAEAEAAIRACTADAVEATAQAIARHLPRLEAEIPNYVNPTARYRSFAADIPRIIRKFPEVS
jgi:hypothetical protein